MASNPSGRNTPRGMSRDRALEVTQGLLHDLRHGMRPYIPPAQAEQVLKHIDALREEEAKKEK